jgi:hypothetical protein
MKGHDTCRGTGKQSNAWLVRPGAEWLAVLEPICVRKMFSNAS